MSLSAEALQFVTEYHLATLTTLRADGSPHVVPVGFTWDAETSSVRVITSGTSVKARNAARVGARAAICQVERRSWITFEGPVSVLTDPESVRAAEKRYAARYRQPRENPRRVVLHIAVERILGPLST